MSEPITINLWRSLLETYYPRPEPEVTYPRQCVDTAKLREHKVPHYVEGIFSASQIVMFSSESLRQAISLGAVWWEDEKGNHVPPPGK